MNQEIRFGKFLLKSRLQSNDDAVDAFAGEQAGFDRPVEVRILKDPAAKDRFLKEAKSLSHFDNPCILKTIDAGTMANRVYCVLPLRRSNSFKEIYEQGLKVFPILSIIEIGKMLAKMTAHLHDKGFLFLDYEMLTFRYDWETELPFINRIRYAITADSLQYIPESVPKDSVVRKIPEALLGWPYDKRSDVYLLCALMYHMATSASPFSDQYFLKNPEGERMLVPISPSSVKGGVPRQVNRLLLKGLARDPAERFASAQELYQALERTTRRLAIQEEVSKSAIMTMSSASIDPELLKAIREKKEQRRREARKRRMRGESATTEETVADSVFDQLVQLVSDNPVAAGISLTLAGIIFIGFFFFQEPGAVSRTGPPGRRHRSSSSHPANGKTSSSGPESDVTAAGKDTTKTRVIKTSGSSSRSLHSSKRSYSKATDSFKSKLRKLSSVTTTRDNFKDRWKLLQKWVKRVPRDVRDSKLFSYSKLVQVKLKFYNEPDAAAEELEELYEKTRRFLEEQ